MLYRSCAASLNDPFVYVKQVEGNNLLQRMRISNASNAIDLLLRLQPILLILVALIEIFHCRPSNKVSSYDGGEPRSDW